MCGGERADYRRESTPACQGGNLRTTASKATAGSGSFGDVTMNHGSVNKVAEANGQRQNPE